MRSASVLTFVVTLLGVASAVPSSRSNNVLHERRLSEPTTGDWIKAGRLDSNKVLPMRIGLIQQNLHRLEEMLMSISHPESPKYAQHLTPMEIVDTFAPSEETISAVTNWLIESGFSRDRLRLSRNKGWIYLNASTSEVENLLSTEYHVYTHPSGDTQIGEACPYVHPRQMILLIVFRLSRLLSAKTSPTACRSHQTYCTLQIPTSLECFAETHWRDGATLRSRGDRDGERCGSDHTFLEKLQWTDDC